jgi:hypothetical protein
MSENGAWELAILSLDNNQKIDRCLRRGLLWFWLIEKAADSLCANQVGHVIELETLDVNSVLRYY